MTPSSVVPFVIEQHAEELATLWSVRTDLATTGHVLLRDLARFDERIAAHLDGCLVGGHEALQVLTTQFASMSPGGVFATTVVAFESNDHRTIDRGLSLAEANPEVRRGMVSALGWVESARLKGFVKDLLAAHGPFRRRLGLVACRLHRVSAGAALTSGTKDSDSVVRAEALRGAGVLGEAHLLSSLASLVDDDPACQFWSAWSAVMLGDKGVAIDALMNTALLAGQNQARAFSLICQVLSTATAHEVLRRIAADAERIRWLIEGSGIVGDPVYVPWLMKHMADDKLGRLAGAAFTCMTGVDLSQSRLEGKKPENFESGPNDDPDDENVGMDPDEGLPWPDPEKVKEWWAKNSGRFQQGTRYFMGAPVTRAHCIDVLKNGYQRQRILAAHYLCLLDPGTPLFNTSAPAWRQQKLLAQMV